MKTLINTATKHLLPQPACRYYVSTGSGVASPIYLCPHHRMHLLFGANTDVGKSVVSTGLVRAAASLKHASVNYIKPLQCGGSDESFVLRHRDDKNRRFKLDGEPGFNNVNCQTLFSWETPASPHLASRLENSPVSDDEVLAALRSSLKNIEDDSESYQSSGMQSITIIESAGGVLSPSSSSPLNESTTGWFWGWSSQAELYAPLGIPVIFVGDGKLGGISVTLASLESLWSRGYQIDAVVFIEGESDGNSVRTSIQFGKGNTEALREYIQMPHNQVPKTVSKDEKRNIPILNDDSIICLPSLPPMPIPLDDWYNSNQEAFVKL
eukprot:CAMPEP_0172530998 /NCGR_PEP_ID=MMETSP1067-20121228/4570_1 /TAXON_ID=265564 ORGANISM="Thalassiosira punctigera, Strain Tpunct2005C2" /NCGR_SAMPLE_ID=MMETSP1067 /ASSEMBLY_ACC=CAM_ASM_000444 /LENGTH=323 /DNA_ID=CAMNT_0013315317 /DNA_START=104 /DNA_END=1072 /DNA_ORIENTATION=-